MFSMQIVSQMYLIWYMKGYNLYISDIILLNILIILIVIQIDNCYLIIEMSMTFIILVLVYGWVPEIVF